jgi:hypothetical protein
MPATVSFDFAVIRIVPRVERGEFINAGVIVFSAEKKFLQAIIHVDEARLTALWPEHDALRSEHDKDVLHRHLRGMVDICAGEPEAGPVAKLSVSERFHWLVAPRSTVIQVSPVHTGLCESPEAALEDLVQRLVEL